MQYGQAMKTPLNASSTTAGGLFSGGIFSVPQFQREYAWGTEEVREFFNDLSKSLEDESYFLGLIIVTGNGEEKDIVDGQQRLLTLTLLVTALYHETVRYDRNALAARLRSTFLRSIDYETDDELSRISLAYGPDNDTLQLILDQGIAEELEDYDDDEDIQWEANDSVSQGLLDAYVLLASKLSKDLASDPFKRLGEWADFLTNRLYLALFVHPDPGSAFRVFEVINTRGKQLTTADLLKSYVLSQTKPDERESRYTEWNELSSCFSAYNPATFVQFIRHAVTVSNGYVLPRDLYDVLTGKMASGVAVSPPELLGQLRKALPLYLQILDPTTTGPATSTQLSIFSVLKHVGVASVRPVLLALTSTPNAEEGMGVLLRQVIRRMVVGNLSTGSIERRFGQAAQEIARVGTWADALADLDDLSDSADEFEERLVTRSMNKQLLALIRASVIQNTVTPDITGSLFLVIPRSGDWPDDELDRVSFWASTIGNVILANEDRRPMGSSTWAGFKNELLPKAVEGEWVDKIRSHSVWGVGPVEDMGKQFAKAAVDVWYSI